MIASKYHCRVIDEEEAKTKTHREVLDILAGAFNSKGVTLLCEPSVVGGKSGPPDIAILDPESGLHIVEVKGIAIEQVKSVQMGGSIEIAYDSKTVRKDPSKQAKSAMFDVKDAATRRFEGELNMAFEAWVAFPEISRKAWENKFGENVSSRPEVLFQEDLRSKRLGARMRTNGRNRLSKKKVPKQQMECLQAAFGDSGALVATIHPNHGLPEGSMGEHLADLSIDNKKLTEQQQQLASQKWDDGPRLVRGVAGSGKTVVLATQIARMVERGKNAQSNYLEDDVNRPILAVCFNRTLVPFIRERIKEAYAQRSGATGDSDAICDRDVEVVHFNGLIWNLAQKNLVKYRSIERNPNQENRAKAYLEEIRNSGNRLNASRYSAVFVDEGQDFHEDDYRILVELCSRTKDDQPRIFIFYDDAQNLYGLKRPTWTNLGFDVRGRTVVMDRSFRNTRQIIEPAFNVLVGCHSEANGRIGTKLFSDVQTLKDKSLVKKRGRHIELKFADREGDPTSFARLGAPADEEQIISKKIQKLVGEEGLRPEDILVLAYHRKRAGQIARALECNLGPGKVHRVIEQRDHHAIQPGKITVSTIASAKGYDAPYVFVASGNEFRDDVSGRASFYVGCTRAREWLEVSSYNDSAIVHEFTKAVAATK